MPQRTLINRGCCSHVGAACRGCGSSAVSRRGFFSAAGLAAASPSGLPAGSVFSSARDPNRQQPIKNPLKVQPVLMYSIPKRREMTSWRTWGGLMNEKDAAEEKDRIAGELRRMQGAANFPVEVRPLAIAQNPEQGAAIGKGDHDVVIMYACIGDVKTLEAMAPPGKWAIMFLRHRSGPVYKWYESAHNRFLRKQRDEFTQPGMDIHDIVVDEYGDLLWRLHALYGVKNTRGKRIVTIGGPSGWGDAKMAPEVAKAQWNLDIQTVSYADLDARLKRARANDALVKRCHAMGADYLKQTDVTLQTDKAFIGRSFLLTEVFRDLMDEAKTDAITVNQCMGTIMKVSETTACMPLSILNDEGYMAFCESDYFVIPSGILLNKIAGTPVFLNDPTYPHHGVVTIAHCTAPRKMNGERAEPVKILTHFESDYGASPKVEMAKGQVLTNLIPDFHSRNWVGFKGEVIGNPFLATCRSQVDVHINGDMEQLLEQMGGFHWMTSYGDYLKETGYALRKVGARLIDVSRRA